ISLMKFLALPLLMIAAEAPAQPAPVAMPSQTAPATLPAPAQTAQTGAWDPVGPYITAGQDEPGYRSWFLAAPWRAAQVKAFNDYLVSSQVGGILPTWTLLRTATSWQECGGQPFEVPPADEWPHMVQTLRYVRDYVIPAVGPVEAVSVYRNPQLNKCAGGAPESAHKLDSAIDMVPLKPITREALMRILCSVHTEHGAAYNAGLGFYAYLRFHVDSTKFRRWNMDPAVAAECPAIVHPEDIASVGQPLPQTAATGGAAASAPAPAPLPTGVSRTVTAVPTSPAAPTALPAAGLASPQGTPSGQPH
ncbi:MAG TPA: D-Ala-D-Ala carboxypeptidase family metallohydrolase, partial [Sphingomicrobium sp.]|nr:D-Ala-D-Ala carboxypeptidase family metallohydrolase [Sphingomicrobium sp.]